MIQASPPASGFRRSFAHLTGGGLDPAASTGSSPASARCRAPFVDFCNRCDLQARPANRRNSHPLRRHVELAPDELHIGRRFATPCEGAKPRYHGSGAGFLMAFAFAGSSRCDCSQRKLGPNPFVSDTSCHRPVVAVAGEPPRAFRVRQRTALTRCPSPDSRAFARPWERAASRTPPRRGVHSAAPEVPSISEPPLWGGPLSTCCPQPVEYGPAPFQSSLNPSP